MPKFSVIIVSYQSSDWIASCLDSLNQQTEKNFEVIIVDNASRDNSLQQIRSSDLKNLHVIESKENLGFAAGCNLAARQARGEWLTFLNPDTMAHVDWLKEISAGQARYPRTNIFACAQYELGEDGKLDGVGDAYFGFGIPWRGGFGHSTKHLPSEGECFSPCGAAAVVRRTVFEKAGGFDERFFCYCEDVDLGFRLRLMGERCVFLPNASVEHKGSAISGRHSDFTIYHGTRNRMWTYVKNMPLGLLVLTAPGHIAISIYLLARSASVGKFKATWRGLRDGVLGLPDIWKSRRARVSYDPAVKIARAMSWNVNDMRKRRPCVKEF